MELLRAGWTLARRRPGLSITSFVGDLVVQIASFAALLAVVLVVAGTLAAASSSSGAGPGAAPTWLLRPRLWVGLAGLTMLWMLGGFTLGAVLRGGLLASLGEMLRGGGRFRLGSYVVGGLALLDRTLPLLLLQRAAPLAGLAFLAPGLVAAAQRALAHPHYVGPHLPTAALLSAGLAGGSLVVGLLSGWVELALAEAALSPERGLGELLGRAAAVLVGHLRPLLRLAALVLLVWTAATLAHVGGLLAINGLAASDAIAPVAPLLQSGLDAAFVLVATVLLVVFQAATLLLYAPLAGHETPAGGALSDPGQPDPAGERVPWRQRLVQAMTTSSHAAEQDSAQDSEPDALQDEADESVDGSVVAEPRPANVFALGDLLEDPSGPPDAGLPPSGDAREQP